MELVERRPQLSDLESALRDASAGHGRVVLVTGECGSGKTALVRYFEQRIDSATTVHWGMCDELITPLPLGPFRDIVHAIGMDTPRDDGESGIALLDAILGELDRGRGTSVVVVEDAHWADDATLDGLRFLGRRVARMPLVLVITFRDDEVPPDHPLRHAVSAIPPDDVIHVALPRLSADGVAELADLAGQGEQAVTGELYELTNGNPFYVTEMLTTTDADVPRSVQDAVLARVSRLSHGGRACVETAAIMPGRAEVDVLAECGVAGRLDEVSRYGLLSVTDGVVRMSHELVRRAIERGMPEARRRALNRQILAALRSIGADCSRLAHHAVQAGDADAVVRHAPVAARRAATLGSHREAAAHYEHALVHANAIPDPEHARLLLEYARECVTTHQHTQAVEALKAAADLFRRLPDGAQSLGASLTELSEAYWFLGNGRAAAEAAWEAIDVLERLPRGESLAAAYAQQAKLAMVDFRPAEAVSWGRKALSLASECGADSVTIHALNTVGTAQWHAPPHDSTLLRESLDRALAADDRKAAARAYNNLACGHLRFLTFEQAKHYIEGGLKLTETNDLPTIHQALLLCRARWHFEEGRWSEALREAGDILSYTAVGGSAVATLIAQIAVRTGDEDAATLLARAKARADATGDAQAVIPMNLARLEYAWLHDDFGRLETLAEETYQAVLSTGVRSWLGASALWLHRAGRLDDPPDHAHEAYALQIIGAYRDAADSWREIGCPYAQADALASSSDPDDMLEALPLLDRVGARPRADLVRRQLSDLGVPHIPRGPRSASRANAAGLTPRQVDVLRLLAADLTYQQIARHLHLAVKTVDHHVTAIRTKLNASTRAEAVELARDLGVLRPHSQPSPGPPLPERPTSSSAVR